MITLIPWEERYSVKNVKIDAQHKELLNMINIITTAIDKGKGKDSLNLLLQKMMEYSIYHFSKEEEAMKKNNFPQLENHKESHSSYIERVNTFYNEYNKGNDSLDMNIMIFLKAWWIDHILNEDRQYIPYI